MAQHLSDAELDLLMDKKIMPMKVQVLSKLEQHLVSLQHALAHHIGTSAPLYPGFILKSSPKISRGENYKEQPYRVLDYPRAFRQADVFTFRTVILWGHGIGFHLILRGSYQTKYQPKIVAQRAQLPSDFQLCQQESPWEWENDPIAYTSLRETPKDSPLWLKDFLKVSYFLPLSSYKLITDTGTWFWKEWKNTFL